MTNHKTGFFPDIPEAEYHASPGISKSGLDLIARSPAHYKYGAPKETTRAMEIGSAIHCALLEPERFATDYVLLRDVTDRRSSAYKEAIKHHPPERVLTGAEAAKVAGMQESIYAQTVARRQLERPGRRELSAFATDPETGVLCRCRYDLLTDDGVGIDLKKTRDARPEEFAKAVFNYRYHVQAAFYSDLYYWLTGDRLSAYAILAVEEDPPHPAAVYVLDDYTMDLGRRLYRRDLNTYAHCLRTDDWPAYEFDVQELSLPEWAIRKTEMELVSHE